MTYCVFVVGRVKISKNSKCSQIFLQIVHCVSQCASVLVESEVRQYFPQSTFGENLQTERASERSLWRSLLCDQYLYDLRRHSSLWSAKAFEVRV